MLYYDRIDVSKWIDVNKKTNQKSVIFVIIGIFWKKGFKFQTNVCNRYHHLLMMSMSLSNIYILNVKNDDYCCIVKIISKRETMKLLQNIGFNWKKLEHYRKINIKSNFQAINLLEILT